MYTFSPNFTQIETSMLEKVSGSLTLAFCLALRVDGLAKKKY